jgi:hypothetical protein
MPRVSLKPLVDAIHGTLSDVTFKKSTKDNTTVNGPPALPKVTWSQAQKTLSQILVRFGYPIVLTIISGYVLVIFIRPVSNAHVGINFYERSKFLEMVHGTAYKPFVYRTLLPTTVHVISLVTPNQFRHVFEEVIGQQYNSLFMFFGWETSAAYEYVTASILMLVSLMGFGHYSAKLVMRTCKLGDRQKTRVLLATSVLLGLPPFFRYTSYVYDPPQLLLFTMALYFLAALEYRNFVLSFILCCVNKETAILLITLYAFLQYKRHLPIQYYWGLLVVLLALYIGIKSLISYAFRLNPGAFTEFQFSHNLDLLTRGWSFSNIAIVLTLLALLFYQWKEKPLFLKVSFLCIFPPLIMLALFLGYIDEWRGYYEAYPIAFGLIVDSLLRLRALFNTGCDQASPNAPRNLAEGIQYAKS